jgi:hypothetical protein
MELWRTAIAILLTFSSGLLFRFALAWPAWARAVAWLSASTVVTLTPCMIPLASPRHRLVASLVAIMVLVKLYDAFRRPLAARELPLREYAIYLLNGFWLVVRQRPGRTRATYNSERLSVAGALAVAAIFLAVFLFSTDWTTWPFLVEHCAKVSVTVVGIAAIANSLACLWRLLGGEAWIPMENPAAAITPADFWRRWNRPVQMFFLEHVFPVGGGFRRPIRAILFTFVVSGLVHEYVFGVATGRVQGWQFLFFLTQGLATVVTIRVSPRGWRTGVWLAGTLVFNLASATFFFRSVDAVYPFYVARGP